MSTSYFHRKCSKCHGSWSVASAASHWAAALVVSQMNTCLKLFEAIKLPDSESAAMLLAGRAAAKRWHF